MAVKGFDFDGKVVLITGAASGIGAASAIEFASRGALLSLIDINDLSVTIERCDETVCLTEMAPKDQRFLAINGDISNTSVCDGFVRDTIVKFGKIDVLVNCAGILLLDSVLNPSLEIFDKSMANNVRPMYHLTSLCAPHLLKAKGNVVNVASVCSKYYLANYLSYTMTKAAIEHFTRHVAAELGPHGVRVNSIHPGTVATNMIGDNLKKCDNMHALNRSGEPEEIAAAIAFIASPRNSFMTGSNVYCDGGMSLKRIR